jgi:hypothetical protein
VAHRGFRRVAKQFALEAGMIRSTRNECRHGPQSRSARPLISWIVAFWATRAYARSSPIEGGTKRRFFAVLHTERINSPVETVRTAIVAGHRHSIGGDHPDAQTAMCSRRPPYACRREYLGGRRETRPFQNGKLPLKASPTFADNHRARMDVTCP